MERVDRLADRADAGRRLAGHLITDLTRVAPMAEGTHDGFPDHTAAAVVLDRDGTAVTDRRAPAAAVRRIERLRALSGHLAAGSGTPAENADGQLPGRHQLWSSPTAVPQRRWAAGRRTKTPI